MAVFEKSPAAHTTPLQLIIVLLGRHAPASRDFPALVSLFLQGRFPLDRFVSERIELDEVEDAFHKMEKAEVLRSVVVL